MKGEPFPPPAAGHLPARNPGDEGSRRTREHGDEVRGGWHPQPGMTPAAARTAGPTPGAGGAAPATPERFRLLRALRHIMRKTRTRSLTGSNRQTFPSHPSHNGGCHVLADGIPGQTCPAQDSPPVPFGPVSGGRLTPQWPPAGWNSTVPYSRGFPYGFGPFL